ncbi:uncharacterized protein LOC107646551 [Arachis ipaensis]|uniref:uncharacterized protein LOC107646551 n=1 Tax=Arachis ipaensis TaxID=130454 RepID=UPI0007AF1D1F|nr:uncharacterized protein LOC107646551 [Arachis ipaensis]XP_025661132.1 uncharacterized protein LOC112756725 [Arachis hypogaea]
MDLLSWNIRGCVNKASIRTVKELCKQYRPDMVILLETKCSGDTTDKVIREMSFNYCIREEAKGFAGGIWVLWNNPNLNVQVLRNHQQFLHLQIVDFKRRVWCLTIVYASPHAHLRSKLWEEMKKIAPDMKLPWLLIGDFNDISKADEKKGGATLDMHAVNRFKRWIEECGLIDMGYIGSKFT